MPAVDGHQGTGTALRGGGLTARMGEVAAVSSGSIGGLALRLPRRCFTSCSDHVPSRSDLLPSCSHRLSSHSNHLSATLTASPAALTAFPAAPTTSPATPPPARGCCPESSPWCFLCEWPRSSVEPGSTGTPGSGGLRGQRVAVQHEDLAGQRLYHLLNPSSFTESRD